MAQLRSGSTYETSNGVSSRLAHSPIEPSYMHTLL